MCQTNCDSFKLQSSPSTPSLLWWVLETDQPYPGHLTVMWYSGAILNISLGTTQCIIPMKVMWERNIDEFMPLNLDRVISGPQIICRFSLIFSKFCCETQWQQQSSTIPVDKKSGHGWAEYQVNEKHTMMSACIHLGDFNHPWKCSPVDEHHMHPFIWTLLKWTQSEFCIHWEVNAARGESSNPQKEDS